MSAEDRVLIFTSVRESRREGVTPLTSKLDSLKEKLLAQNPKSLTRKEAVSKSQLGVSDMMRINLEIYQRSVAFWRYAVSCRHKQLLHEGVDSASCYRLAKLYANENFPMFMDPRPKEKTFQRFLIDSGKFRDGRLHVRSGMLRDRGPSVCKVPVYPWVFPEVEKKKPHHSRRKIPPLLEDFGALPQSDTFRVSTHPRRSVYSMRPIEGYFGLLSTTKPKTRLPVEFGIQPRKGRVLMSQLFSHPVYQAVDEVLFSRSTLSSPSYPIGHLFGNGRTPRSVYSPKRRLDFGLVPHQIKESDRIQHSRSFASLRDTKLKISFSLSSSESMECF